MSLLYEERSESVLDKMDLWERNLIILLCYAHGKGCHSMKVFSVVGPTMWNELLTNELRECTSVDVFKKRLKTHLFHLHY